MWAVLLLWTFLEVTSFTIQVELDALKWTGTVADSTLKIRLIAPSAVQNGVGLRSLLSS